MRVFPSRRLTLTDVLVGLLLLVLPVGGLLAGLLGKTRTPAYRLLCASNLRQIGQAIQIYTSDNGGRFPRAAYDGRGGTPTEYSNWQSADPFQGKGPGPNDVTAALFLLLRHTEIGPEVFLCPSVAWGKPWDYDGRTVTEVSNFPGRQYLQYSFVNPYPTPAAEAAGFKLDMTAAADFALAADMNPGGAAVVDVAPTSPRQRMVLANTPNHVGDGQNVLYADGHVEFQNTPFCGVMRNGNQPGGQFRDNIYTHGSSWRASSGAGIRGAPVDAADTVLLPTALDGPEPLVPASPGTLLLRGIIAAMVAGAAVGYGVIRRRDRRKRHPPSPSAQ